MSFDRITSDFARHSTDYARAAEKQQSEEEDRTVMAELLAGFGAKEEEIHGRIRQLIAISLKQPTPGRLYLFDAPPNNRGFTRIEAQVSQTAKDTVEVHAKHVVVVQFNTIEYLAVGDGWEQLLRPPLTSFDHQYDNYHLSPYVMTTHLGELAAFADAQAYFEGALKEIEAAVGLVTAPVSDS